MEPIYFNPQVDVRPSLNMPKGCAVRLPKGVEVLTMHPARKSYTTSRAQVVCVDHVLTGRFMSVREALDEYRDALVKRGLDLSRMEAWRRDNAMEYYRMMVQIVEP